MDASKDLMDKFVKYRGKEIFSLFYKIMTGNFRYNNLTDEEKIMSQCIQNEFTSKNGACYNYRREIEKAKKSNDIKKLSMLYDSVIEIMCEKMFFNSLKLGYVLKNTLE